MNSHKVGFCWTQGEKHGVMARGLSGLFDILSRKVEDIELNSLEVSIRNMPLLQYAAAYGFVFIYRKPLQ